MNIMLLLFGVLIILGTTILGIGMLLDDEIMDRQPKEKKRDKDKFLYENEKPKQKIKEHKKNKIKEEITSKPLYKVDNKEKTEDREKE